MFDTFKKIEYTERTPYLNSKDGKYDLVVKKAFLRKSSKGPQQYFIVNFETVRATPVSIPSDLLKPGELNVAPFETGEEVSFVLDVGSEYFGRDFLALYCALSGKNAEDEAKAQTEAVQKAIYKDGKNEQEAIEASPMVKAFKGITSDKNPLEGVMVRAETSRRRTKKDQIITTIRWTSAPEEENSKEAIQARKAA